MVELKLAEQKIIGFKLQSQLDEKLIKKSILTVVKGLEVTNTFNIYIQIEKFDEFKFETFIIHLKYSFSFLKKHHLNINKIAFVSNYKINKKLTLIDNALMPGINLRAFKLNQFSEARTWLKQ